METHYHNIYKLKSAIFTVVIIWALFKIRRDLCAYKTGVTVCVNKNWTNLVSIIIVCAILYFALIFGAVDLCKEYTTDESAEVAVIELCADITPGKMHFVMGMIVSMIIGEIYVIQNLYSYYYTPKRFHCAMWNKK